MKVYRCFELRFGLLRLLREISDSLAAKWSDMFASWSLTVSAFFCLVDEIRVILNQMLNSFAEPC